MSYQIIIINNSFRTIEYYEEVFDHGYYNLEEHGIDANIFNLESKKIKTM